MLPEPRFNLAAALAFQITSRILRQGTQQLSVRQTYPGGGTYNCVSLFYQDMEEMRIVNLADFNLVSGRVHPHNAAKGTIDFSALCEWPSDRDYVLAATQFDPSIDSIARDISRTIGIEATQEHPKSGSSASQALGLLLQRFAFEDKLFLENGFWYGEDNHPDWLSVLEADSEIVMDATANWELSGLWYLRSNNNQACIFDFGMDMVFLIDPEIGIDLNSIDSVGNSLIPTINRVESHLRGFKSPKNGLINV